MKFTVIAAYQFIQLENLAALREQFKKRCLELGLKGTILLAPEGFNCFIAGSPEQISSFKAFLEQTLGINQVNYKENYCSEPPFVRMLVKIKKEIISMGMPEIQPAKMTAPRLSAKELKDWLDRGKKVVLLDTRNHYEIAAGTFENATHLNLNNFRSFPNAIESLPAEMKDETVVTFCTGGIRCEKASALMMKQGFKDVYQLEGGILKYFEECSSAYYQGNCFVFDWRLAVDSELKPQNRTDENPAEAGRHRIRLDG